MTRTARWPLAAGCVLVGCVLVGCVLAAGVSPAVAQPRLSLEEAVSLAQANDPWLRGSELRQEAARAEAVAAGQLPDPTVSLGLANLPVDTFDFNQEPMTRFNVGLAQVFPRGKTRALRQRQFTEFSERHVHLRADRLAKVEVTVAHLWLESFRQHEAIRLIEQDHVLFEHLVDVAQSSYSSAQGQTRQQDLIRAQLELTRLEDRLHVLHERFDTHRLALGEWLPASARDSTGHVHQAEFRFGSTLPELDVQQPGWLAEPAPAPESLYALLSRHPAILSIEHEISASNTGIKIAEQRYKPQWGVEARYGYRDRAPTGADRADFFSVAVTLDLPLFTSKRQDQAVQAARASAAATQTDKVLALRAMRASFEAAGAKLLRLNQRQALYQQRLLGEVSEQAEASLSAYTNDDGDFAEVVRARIAELNAHIDALNIAIDRLKVIVQLNYFFALSPPLGTPGADR